MAINKIYLHWSATGYNFTQAGLYHTIVQGDGRIIRLTSYDQLSAHTFKRNSNAVGIACACMGGVPFQDFPPTPIQVENMCREAAELAKKLGWKASDIRDLTRDGVNSVNRILTHAEAAANRDFPKSLVDRGTGVSDGEAIALGLPHNNYGPSSWFDGWSSGTFERWDFFKVKSTDENGSGGNILRNKIRGFMGTPAIAPPTASGTDCEIFLNNNKIATGSLLSDGRCYVKLLDLLSPFNIELGRVQGGEDGFINLISDKFRPKFLTDSPLISGFPTVDVFLNRPIDSDGNPVGDARNPIQPFIGGILIGGSTHVLIADFCSELGISLTFDANVPAVRLTTT